MLSSLPGAAVSSVKIKGVLHEFSSIPGVKEDVPEIIMNIKSLAIKNNSSSAETKQAYIEFSGKGVVTAGDIKADSDIEILNPELVIATLSDDSSKLDMELTITNGRGYVGADKADKEGKAIDEIAVDAIYTPVERVNLKVENTRVGQITDYDKLTLDVPAGRHLCLHCGNTYHHRRRAGAEMARLPQWVFRLCRKRHEYAQSGS